MVETNEELLFNEALCARVRELRDAKDWTAERMADILGIPVERYRKYERRSLLPHYLIPRFAAIVDRSIEYILTGRDAPSVAAPRQVQKRRSA